MVGCTCCRIIYIIDNCHTHLFSHKQPSHDFVGQGWHPSAGEMAVSKCPYVRSQCGWMLWNLLPCMILTVDNLPLSARPRSPKHKDEAATTFVWSVTNLISITIFLFNPTYTWWLAHIVSTYSQISVSCCIKLTMAQVIPKSETEAITLFSNLSWFITCYNYP